MNKILLSITGLLLLAACSGDAPPLEGARLGGAFSLTDQNSQKITEKAFADQYFILYVGYTNCPDICPTDSLAIGSGLKRFEAASPDRGKRVTPVFLTGDPRRDTAPALKKFLANFHPRFVGLTGSEAEIDPVLRQFGSYALRGKPDSFGGYDVDHGRVTNLYGPDGRPIAPVPSDAGAEEVAKTLDKWVK